MGYIISCIFKITHLFMVLLVISYLDILSNWEAWTHSGKHCMNEHYCTPLEPVSEVEHQSKDQWENYNTLKWKWCPSDMKQNIWASWKLVMTTSILFNCIVRHIVTSSLDAIMWHIILWGIYNKTYEHHESLSWKLQLN